ncbi:hypothetical protein VTP01DRAFT_942 [Rhizomucor pusillus]|uniref:uncharacterized protein n=1 Tax=Rhizomucor pusillus TaxID=4840 RepID=UPI003742458D
MSTDVLKIRFAEPERDHFVQPVLQSLRSAFASATLSIMPTTRQTGLYRVPTTKFLMIFFGGCSLLTSIFDLKHLTHLQLIPHITRNHQFWRLLTSQCAFGNSGGMFFGMLILYSMRVIERQYGSAKYAAFVFVATMISILLEIGALVSGAKFGFRRIVGGPFGLLFALLYQYHRVIPVTYRFRVFGFTFNDKTPLYVLALQLVLSQSFGTAVPCMCGLMAGALYRSDVGSIKQWRFPSLLRSFASRFLEPLLSTSPIPRTTATMPNSTDILGSNVALPNDLRQRRTASGAATATRIGRTAVREYIDTITGESAGSELQPPSEEHTALLMTMFPDHPREVIVRALSSANNNVNRAVEIMLNVPAPQGNSTNNGNSANINIS